MSPVRTGLPPLLRHSGSKLPHSDSGGKPPHSDNYNAIHPLVHVPPQLLLAAEMSAHFVAGYC